MDVPTDQAGPALPATEIPAGERERGPRQQRTTGSLHQRGDHRQQPDPASSPPQRYPSRSCYDCGVAARMSGDVLYCGGLPDTAAVATAATSSHRP